MKPRAAADGSRIPRISLPGRCLAGGVGPLSGVGYAEPSAIRPDAKGVAMTWIFAAAVLFAADTKADVDAAELKKLAGAWAVISLEHGGKKTAMKELAPLAVTVAGEKMTTRDKTDVKEESEVVRLDA